MHGAEHRFEYAPGDSTTGLFGGNLPGAGARYAQDPHFKELVLFSEYFHGEYGRGVGASHQTGWTALVARCLEALAQRRSAREQAAE